MNLLLDEVDGVKTSGDPTTVDVRGVTHDSRLVAPGDLYCCIPGHLDDGHRYAAEAVSRGAVGLLCEHLVPGLHREGVVQAVVEPGRVRPAMARLAAAFWGHPARSLLMAGVTGTNGKTSVTHLLGAVLRYSGRPTTVVGTLSGARTTPEATDLQRLLAEVRDGVPVTTGGPPPAVAMEVSSHALAQSRVDGIHFDVAVFTNLSHDHLDYHGTMEDYYEAKASLFTSERAVLGVVGADDRWGRRLLAEARIPVVAVTRDQAADVVLAAGCSTFTWRSLPVRLAMTGAVNVENALLAAEAAVALGLEPAEVAAGLGAAPPVPGRMEVLATPTPGGPDCTVLVDYAHTPTGLEVVLAEARRLAGPAGRVLVVCGCGGDRDRQKRPLMGAAATGGADMAVLTSDNPRHEDPAAILDEMVAGVDPSAAEVRAAGRLVIEPDRRRAIELAVAAAGPGDVLVVAGKGHETVQEVGDRQMPFDDRTVVTEALAARWPGDPAGWLRSGGDGD
jgi:UDP-N-acetylmuramoyl-L-alanyl-D-glutamate--2,6-diaminopimelate ligase